MAPRRRGGFAGPPEGPYGINWGSSQANGLVAWYPLMGHLSTGGRRVQELARGNHAAPTSALDWIGDRRYGRALNFPANGYIPLPRLGLFGPSNQPFTVCLRANAAADTAMKELFSAGGSWVSDSFVLIYNYPSPHFMTVFQNGTSRFACNCTLSPGSWYDIAVTYNELGHARLYINGVQPWDGYTLNTASNAGFADTWAIGADCTQGYLYPWSGQIGDVRLYRRCLSAGEMADYAHPSLGWDLAAPLRPWDRVQALAVTSVATGRKYGPALQ